MVEVHIMLRAESGEQAACGAPTHPSLDRRALQKAANSQKAIVTVFEEPCMSVEIARHSPQSCPMTRTKVQARAAAPWTHAVDHSVLGVRLGYNKSNNSSRQNVQASVKKRKNQARMKYQNRRHGCLTSSIGKSARSSPMVSVMVRMGSI